MGKWGLHVSGCPVYAPELWVQGGLAGFCICTSQQPCSWKVCIVVWCLRLAAEPMQVCWGGAGACMCRRGSYTCPMHHHAVMPEWLAASLPRNQQTPAEV